MIERAERMRQIASSNLEVDATAVGISAFRVLPNGDGRQYSAVVFARGRQGCETFLRRAAAVGWIHLDDNPYHYAVLDVLNADGDIIQDFLIRDASAFRSIKRKLKLVVEGSEERS